MLWTSFLFFISYKNTWLRWDTCLIMVTSLGSYLRAHIQTSPHATHSFCLDHPPPAGPHRTHHYPAPALRQQSLSAMFLDVSILGQLWQSFGHLSFGKSLALPSQMGENRDWTGWENEPHSDFILASEGFFSPWAEFLGPAKATKSKAWAAPREQFGWSNWEHHEKPLPIKRARMLFSSQFTSCCISVFLQVRQNGMWQWSRLSYSPPTPHSRKCDPCCIYKGQLGS